MVVSIAGVFAGIAGLGIGFVIGWTWELLHRRRRSRRQEPESTIEVAAAPTTQPRLRLVQTARTDTSHVVGSRLTSVTFLSRTVEFDFSGVIIETEGQAIVSSGSARYDYPEDGSRDALCRLIGATVRRMRISDSNEVHLTFDDGSDLTLFPRV